MKKQNLKVLIRYTIDLHFDSIFNSLIYRLNYFIRELVIVQLLPLTGETLLLWTYTIPAFKITILLTTIEGQLPMSGKTPKNGNRYQKNEIQVFG